ncbi:MAG TPA: nucleoside:proton symporter, partial [Alphaproteobacteria bacterium]|nr:nucleoside:proton symporter [Alphaproteobacteria bacterium]
MHLAQGVLGIAAILGFAWLVSEDRRAFPWRTVIAGMLLQLLIAAVLLKVPQFRGAFLALNEALMSLERATAAGTTFVFGFLGGGELPYAETAP